MRSRLLALLAALALVVAARPSSPAAATTTTTTATATAAASDLGTIEEGQLLVGTDTPYPAVRDRPAARHHRLSTSR